MKYNPYYLDFNDQKVFTPIQVKKIKENNFSMASALNQLINAIKQGPDAIQRFRKDLGKHDVVKYDDAETGISTHDFTNRLRFLASQLEHDKNACRIFTNESGCGRALTYLFAGFNYQGTEKDFCDKYCRWKEYQSRSTAFPAFKGKDPLAVALYIQQKEESMPIGLDYAAILNNVVPGENGNFIVNFRDDGRAVLAANEQLFELKTNETFYNNFYNDYYSSDDDEIVKKAYTKRKMDYRDWKNYVETAHDSENEQDQ